MRTAETLPLLPEVLRRTAQPGRPLAALLEVMEGLHARDELILAGLDAYFDPARAPDAFLSYLASWVGLGWVPVAGVRDRMDVTFGVEPAALRRLIAAAPRLAQTRGTAEGLALLLRTATGVPDIAVTDSPGAGIARPFHLRVVLPAGAAAQRPLVEYLVRTDKPAHATCDVVVLEAPPSGEESPKP